MHREELARLRRENAELRRALAGENTARHAKLAAAQPSDDAMRKRWDRVSDSVVIHDVQGYIVDANRHAWESVGISREQFIGANLREFDLGLAKIPMDRYGRGWAEMENGRIFHVETNWRHADGHVIPMEVRVAAHEEHGTRLFVATCRDISDRRRAETGKARSEQRFSALFESSPVAMSMELDGRMSQCNPALANLLGYTEREIIEGVNASPTTFLHPDEADTGETQAEKLERQQIEAYRVVQRWVRATGEVRWVQMSRFRDDSPEDGPSQSITFYDDITERKLREVERERLYDELERQVLARTAELSEANTRLREEIIERQRAEQASEAAKQAAEAANRAKSHFLASMSHELRTPLNAVIGYAELLEEEAEDTGQPQMIADLQKIKGAGRHLLGIINDILDLSKVEAGKMELSFEEVELRPLAENVVHTVSAAASANGNQVELDIAPEVTSMTVDVTRLQQILLNLMSNACKFTENGTIRLSLDVISTELGSASLRFRVRDTGIGIEKAQLPRLFDPFTQADATTTRRYGGTGLGLSICHRFCGMLGGELSVDSTPGEGSIFTVVLPIRHDAEALAKKAREAAEGHHRSKVLVVDDDPDSRTLLGRILSREGYLVYVANGGHEAIELAERFRPDLITLDVVMPDMDGWAVLAALKAHPELHSIPVLMVTITNERQMGLALGAKDYLSKPIERERLVQAVERYACRGDDQRVALIVDDDPDARDLVQRALARDSWQVDTAEHGRAGLDRMQSRLPHVVILDLMMPEMDGFAVLEAMRDDERLRNVPVVVLTHKDLNERERSFLSERATTVMERGGRQQAELLHEIRVHVARASGVVLHGA